MLEFAASLGWTVQPGSLGTYRGRTVERSLAEASPAALCRFVLDLLDGRTT